MIIKALGPVDRVCLALTSKHLVLVANFVYLTIPASKVLPKAECDSGKRRRPTRGRSGDLERTDRRTSQGKLGSEHMACARLLLRRNYRGGWITGSWKLDEVKNRDVAKASQWKTNRKRAEENRSFAKCIETWCAKVPRDHVCPRCHSRARSGG